MPEPKERMALPLIATSFLIGVTIGAVVVNMSEAKPDLLTDIKRDLSGRCEAQPDVLGEIEHLQGTPEHPITAETLRQVLKDVVNHC